MYALVNLSGIQIKIEEGKNIKVPFQNKKIGSKIKLDNVLFFCDGKKKQVGTPYIKSLSFDAKIISHDKDSKIIVYKKKRRKGYEKKRGHRQNFSTILISAFKTKSKIKSSITKKAKPDKKSNLKKTSTK